MTIDNLQKVIKKQDTEIKDMKMEIKDMKMERERERERNLINNARDSLNKHINRNFDLNNH